MNAREDKYLRTPVFDVALRCDLPMLKLLCERGVQPESEDQPGSPGASGDVLDLKVVDKFQYTPLHHLLNSQLEGPAVDILFAMLSNGSDPNSQDKVRVDHESRRTSR